jgi:hypothetical protein
VVSLVAHRLNDAVIVRRLAVGALPSTTDIKVPYVSLVPIGRLVGFDHRSGLFVFNSNFLLANEPVHDRRFFCDKRNLCEVRRL